ncbi:MAG TPA: ATP-dependent Clp protease proteolytic subunit [Patescibacteria group bacterium]|nr:MAG: hypothetical protein UR43_C0005G0093 [candidate division TM6 bacterium GW2011_GWF2_33_332]HLD91074.1 ATP-dependent Clp protease proteolytic subunit [Patescibacteria group bacterium]
MAKKDKESTQYWIEKGIDVENRILDIDDYIDSETVSPKIRALRCMQRKSNDPITINVNSMGGCVYNSFALYDTIRDISNSGILIRTMAYGSIMSGGSIIFLAGDERSMLINTTTMIHTINFGVEGKVKEVEIEMKESKRLEEKMIEIYASRTKKSKRFWKKQIKYIDNYYDYKTSKKLGIINK